ncbi:MAG: hypothetical protein ACI8S6_003615 [Myxococcota bacterium]|jgi:hypothetical protein
MTKTEAEDEPHERLVFLISAPRSGSTLLTRIVNATAHVHSRPEPHLITPLAHLGFWRRVHNAPYDPIVSQRAQRQLIAELPGGDADYLAACRAYTDAIYGPLLKSGGKRYFLDKTPAYALALPFLMQLYPRARYLVLTRHPAAIFSSHADSFFDGDDAAAARHNPVLARYIPPIAALLRDPPEHCLHLRYEDLVAEPEQALDRIGRLLGCSLDPAALDYQQAPLRGEGPGDPLGVHRHYRPVTESSDRWAREMADHPGRFEAIEAQLGVVAPEDLALWGYPEETLWASLDGSRARRRRRWDRFSVQRRVLLLGRALARRRGVRQAVVSLRDGCELLLRGE